MFNWFKKRKTKPSTELKVIEPDMEKFKQIFLDEEEPISSITTENTGAVDSERELADNKVKEINLLTQFLERDHFNAGYSLGYNEQSQDIFEVQLRRLKSQFSQVLEKLIDNERDQIKKIKQAINKCRYEDMSEIRDNLNLEIEEHETNLVKLRTELDLVALEEGWFSSPCDDFKAGFKTGFKEGMEVKLFANTSKLFK